MNCYHAFLKTLIWMATGVKLELAKWSEYQLVFTWLDWNQPGQLHIFFSGAIYSLYKSRRGRELSRNIREIRQEGEIVNCFQLVPIGKLIISLTCRYCEYLLNMLYLVDIYISYHWWRHFRKNALHWGHIEWPESVNPERKTGRRRNYHRLVTAQCWRAPFKR